MITEIRKQSETSVRADKLGELVSSPHKQPIIIQAENNYYEVEVIVAEDDGSITVSGLELDPDYFYETALYPSVLSFSADDEVALYEIYEREARSWWDLLPSDIRSGKRLLTEDDAWQAIADFRECDVSEIADGDIIEFL